MQYIITKYHGPTNTKPASVTAKQSGGPLKVRINIGPEDTVSTAELRAVETILVRLKWGAMYRAGTHDNGAVWCFPPERHATSWSGCQWADGFAPLSVAGA